MSVAFDLTITLGNVIEIAAIIGGGLTVLYKLNSRMTLRVRLVPSRG
jgi:hypothetical protein